MDSYVLLHVWLMLWSFIKSKQSQKQQMCCHYYCLFSFKTCVNLPFHFFNISRSLSWIRFSRSSSYADEEDLFVQISSQAMK